MVYCVLAATHPQGAVIGGGDRDAIKVQHIFPYLSSAENKAREMRRDVLASLAADLGVNEQFVDRMMAYRKTIKVETRYMAPWPKEE